MASRPKVVSDPLLVDLRLSQLGLTKDVPRNAILAARVAWASCTENDPPSYAGQTLWAVATRVMREQLLTWGWIKSDAANFSTVVNGDGTLAIVVATGDSATGIEDATPKTKCPKGPLTEAAVQANGGQFALALYPITEVQDPRPASDEDFTLATWVLLVFHGRNAYGQEEFRSELSLPKALGVDERIEDWHERIILDVITDDGGGPGVLPDVGPDLDIPVIRRAK